MICISLDANLNLSTIAINSLKHIKIVSSKLHYLGLAGMAVRLVAFHK